MTPNVGSSCSSLRQPTDLEAEPLASSGPETLLGTVLVLDEQF
jgi:hypothetical protein